MNLQNQRELATTREKLKLLEQQFTAHQSAQTENGHVREISRRSLKRLINQLKEEIARFEAQDAISG